MFICYIWQPYFRERLRYAKNGSRSRTRCPPLLLASGAFSSSSNCPPGWEEAHQVGYMNSLRVCRHVSVLIDTRVTEERNWIAAIGWVTLPWSLRASSKIQTLCANPVSPPSCCFSRIPTSWTNFLPLPRTTVYVHTSSQFSLQSKLSIQVYCSHLPNFRFFFALSLLFGTVFQ